MPFQQSIHRSAIPPLGVGQQVLGHVLFRPEWHTDLKESRDRLRVKSSPDSMTIILAGERQGKKSNLVDYGKKIREASGCIAWQPVWVFPREYRPFPVVLHQPSFLTEQNSVAVVTENKARR